MTPDQLPPLPEPDGWRITDGEGGYNYTDESPSEFARAWAGRYQRQHHALFTTDTLRAYATAATAALRAEMDALRRDAERYRWLCTTLGETQLPTLIERITKGYVADYKPSIDAAIDAAMKETP